MFNASTDIYNTSLRQHQLMASERNSNATYFQPINDLDDVIYRRNASLIPPRNQSSSVTSLRYYINDVILPTVFSLGVAGNIINLLLLSSRRVYGERRASMERSAVAGLRALAASDLLFCLVGLSETFLSVSNLSADANSTLMNACAYYVYHRGAFMNLFLFLSTWLIVLVSVER